MTDYLVKADLLIGNDIVIKDSLRIDNDYIHLDNISAGKYSIVMYYNFAVSENSNKSYLMHLKNANITETAHWTLDNNRAVDLSDVGLSIDDDYVVAAGDTITQRLVKRINTVTTLMPSIYRKTDGAERFYNAINGKYTDEDGNAIVFPNPYVEGKPVEHIVKAEDIKPTIKEKEVNGLRIDMFSEFAYDLDDNDETYDDEEDGSTNYEHPYFFGKLRIMDFNLFDHAIENQPMTVSFTSGNSGACNFEIGVTEEYPQINPVQVDENGNLLYDTNGRVLCGTRGSGQSVHTYQERQQDTSKYEVWIALKKEESTYGIIMPKAEIKNAAGEVITAGHRPKPCTAGQNDGDTFVLIGINLPQPYIDSAEKKLEDEIIRYMREFNEEKFTFSITFSRIYFEENPDVLALLNENTRLNIEYNGKTYLLYVSSFSYSMSENEPLPQITVELNEELTVASNPLQNAVSEIKGDVNRKLSNIDFAAIGSRYFIRKDTDDEVDGITNFKKGIKFGNGGKVEILDNNSAKLTIEYLEITKKATFTSLEVQEKTHAGGQILLTPAAIVCGEVEEFDDFYRCYFQTQNENNSEQIFNQFAVGDQAVCQTYNEWGSRYYWRLVVGVGDYHIDLSKTDCDELSDVPIEGDKIIQLGNRNDAGRQSAIVLSTIGENAPSYVVYNGINSYSLDETAISGSVFNPEFNEPQLFNYGSFFFGDRDLTDPNATYITFQKKEGDSKKRLYVQADIMLGAGSSGLENLSEWAGKQEAINNAKNTADSANEKAEGALQASDLLKDAVNDLNATTKDLQNQIDGAIEAWGGTDVPTLENAPANEWSGKIDPGTGKSERDRHIGDYYDREITTDGQTSYERYKFTKNGNTYEWRLIADDGGAKALAEAKKALGIANGKSKVFYQTSAPSAPYKVDDLWIKTDTGVMYISLAERASGDVVGANDWLLINDTSLRLLMMSSDVFITKEEKASLRKQWAQIQIEYAQYERDAANYDVSIINLSAAYNNLEKELTATVNIEDDNDTPLEENQRTAFNTAFANWYSSVSDFCNLIAQKKVDDVKPDIKAAKELAEAANAELSELKSDGTISPVEKTALKQQMSDIMAERSEILSHAAMYGLSLTAFNDAYTSAIAALEKYTAATPEYITVESDYEDIAAYYEARTKILSSINGASDIRYLQELFPNSTISAGAVIAQMAVVTDSANKVIAGINGTTTGADTATNGHGKVLIFAGSDGVTDTAIANAATMIYEDGTIMTKKLIATSGCKIGNLEITSEGEDYYALHGKRGSYGSLPATESYILPDDIKLILNDSYYERQIELNCEQLAAESPAVTIKSSAKKNSRSGPCLTLDAYGNFPLNDDLAIQCVSGMFAGLRPMLRTITSTITLNYFDHTIFVATTSAITITLPSNPPIGQEIVILFKGTSSATNKCTVTTTANTIKNYWENATHATHQINMRGIVLYTFVYDNGSKYWIYNRIK